MANHGRKLIRKQVYSLDLILSRVLLVPKKPKEAWKFMDLDGDLVNMASDRYKCFKIHGTRCAFCKIEGRFFAKERYENNGVGFHLNLYAIDENGKEVLMTKDHKLPKSKGGKSHPDNYMTLCAHCNVFKNDS
jgi:hypothetical protein